MSQSIDEMVDQLPPADRFRVLTRLARKVLAEQPGQHFISLGTVDEPLNAFLIKYPPMPDMGSYTDADRAEDARRLATLDNTVTLDELIDSMDFRSDREREGS